MDLWVVAAAAASGYIAKYWQNFSRDKDSLSELSSRISDLEKPESPSCSVRKHIKDVLTERRKKLDKRYTDMSKLDGTSVVEEASSSDFDGGNMGRLGNYNSHNLLSISSLPPGSSESENLNEIDFGDGLTSEVGDNPGSSTGQMGSFRDSPRYRKSLRTRHLYRNVKPLSSLESCLMAQLYQKHVEMEEYMLSSVPSPSTPTMRPLFLTDGSRIISRASGEFHGARISEYEKKVCKVGYLDKIEVVCGVPPLPKIKSLDPSRKMTRKSGKGRLQRLSFSNKSSDGSQICSQSGSHDRNVLFCLGISVGIIYSFMENIREVGKLKELLKQTENLVQDLQEELEMKNSLTVKELVNENYEPKDDTCNIPNPLCIDQNSGNSEKVDDKELHVAETGESIESMSKIEAELEAELERMGLNLNTSNSLERRLSDFVELDTDFEVDFAKGELRADKVNTQTVESNHDASGTSTGHSANYAVSPRELSLRLHEVIQSRLEERVKELEAALENSQRKVQSLELDKRNSSWRDLSKIELRYDSSSGESPVARNDYNNSMAEPLVMNLSGEALDTYNEAYEELMKINDSDDENDSLSGFYGNDHEIGSEYLFSGDGAARGQNGEINHVFPDVVNGDVKPLKEALSGEGKRMGGLTVRAEEPFHVCGSEDDEEKSDYDEEMEKQLIQQIVEKTKKGSPVVLNAQRLYLMDEK